MQQLVPKMWDLLEIDFWFLSVFIIFMSSWYFKKSYHGTGSDQFSSKPKGVLASVACDIVVSAHRAGMAKNGESLSNF